MLENNNSTESHRRNRCSKWPAGSSAQRKNHLVNALTTQPGFREDPNGEPAVCTAETNLTQEAEECLAQADMAYKNGNLPSACEFLQQGLVHSPRNLPLILCLGNIQFQMNDFPSAFESFKAALGMDTHNVETLVRLAIAAAYCGRSEAFEDNMARAFEIEPNNADALRFLARLNMEEKRYDSAARQFSRVLRQIPNDLDSLLLAGQCHLKLDNQAAAKKMFEQALCVDSTNAVAAEKLDFIRIESRFATDSPGVKATAC